MDLVFLVVMLYYLNRLNLNLQGKLKMLPDLVQSVFAFVNKLNLFKAHVQKGYLTHFPTLLKTKGQVTSAALNEQKARHATLLETLQERFVPRFRDLQLKRPQISFLVDLFNFEPECLKALLVSDEAAAEFIDDRSLWGGPTETCFKGRNLWVLKKCANEKIPQCQVGCA